MTNTNKMAKENKTKPTEMNVEEFLNSVENEQKRKDSFELLERMKKISGREPKMWGPTMIGFGGYHYKYDSGHEGNSFLIGFSPRKSAISLYVNSCGDANKALLGKLGKFKMGKACIYANKLSDIHLETLDKLMIANMEFLESRYTITE